MATTEIKYHAGWAVGNVTEHGGEEQVELVALFVLEGQTIINPAEARRVARALNEAADSAEAANG